MSVETSYFVEDPLIIVNYSTRNQIKITEKRSNSGIVVYFATRGQLEELYTKIGKVLINEPTPVSDEPIPNLYTPWGQIQGKEKEEGIEYDSNTDSKN